MTPLIGITGQKGAGKDTVAAHLIEHHGYKRLGLADAVRAEVANAIHPSDAYTSAAVASHKQAAVLAYIEEHKRDPLESPTGWCRQILQAWGEMRRDIHGADYWLHQIYMGPHRVIADIRYPGEVEAVRAAQGVVWRVERPGYGSDGTPSESHAAGLTVDAVLHNGTDLAGLATQIDWLMEQLAKGCA